MTLIVVLLTISLIILLFNITLLYLFPEFTRREKSKDDLLNISVLVASKNEEKNIGSLFSSLDSLNYPQDKFEVILVDDESSDNSYQKAIELAKGKSNYQIIKAENKKYPGKKGALEFAVGKASFPNILITDADCMPQKNWLKAYSESFIQGYEMLFGLAPFIQTKKIISDISCFENMRGSILTFGLAKLKLPYSAAARNLGFKKSAFKYLGGFSKTISTISGDDDLLLREAVKHDMKIGIVDFQDSYVLSNSKATLGEYLNQKARHTKTSHHYLLIHKLLLGFWHSSNILALFSIILLPLNIIFALPFLIKLIGDSLVVTNTQKRFKYSFLFHEIIFHQLVYELFLILNFIASFRKIIPWKN